ncbi:MAG TPA: MFS transporter [Burkholderiales bacterium]|nr:MFS transporter [Burkholderiales bacterium]
MTLAGLSLVTLLASLGTSSANVALPTLAQAFEASFQDVQWVVLAYLLAMTMFVVAAGRLGDLVGRRRLLLAGLALFTLASVLCAVAPTLPLLVAARAAQGLGAAAMIALAMALVGQTIPKARVGSAMGLLGTMSAVGTALGPSLAGLLLSGFGWRAIFLLNVPLGGVAFVLASRSLPVDGSAQPAARPAFDKAGMALLAVAIAAYSLAATPRGGFGIVNAALLAAAALGLALFVRAEARAPAPLVRLAMFRNAGIAAGFTMTAVVATVVMATLVVGPFYLSRALGLRPVLVGMVMSCGPLVAALAGMPSGRLVDRLGAKTTIAAGLAAMVLGCTALAVIPATFGAWGYAAPLMVITAGYALFQAANNTAVMAGSSADERGVISGLLNLSRNLGLVTGASAMGALFTLASGASDVATAAAGQVARGMHIAFGVAAALLAAALAVATISPRLGE